MASFIAPSLLPDFFARGSPAPFVELLVVFVAAFWRVAVFGKIRFLRATIGIKIVALIFIKL